MGIKSDAGRKTSHEETVKGHLHVLYSQKIEQNQIFMQDLTEYRKKKEKTMLKSIKVAVGPSWYQALSVTQRRALDNLKFAIYQDLLEGRSGRTSQILRTLGLYPRPCHDDLFVCIGKGRDDPKKMIAELYYLTFGYPIEGRRISYNLNAKLMLSAIFYLGLDNLIYLLRERFRPDQIIEELPQKSKSKPEPSLASPYLQKMVAFLWEKPKPRRLPPPPPLPNLDDLDEPYEEEPVIPRPPPPPPPPPPPKKRIPVSICNAMAGIYSLNQDIDKPIKSAGLVLRKSLRPGRRKSRSSKASLETKKVYGLNLGFSQKPIRRQKPLAPSTGLANAQYNITGVYEINGKARYILGNVSVLPAQGDSIHGGCTYVGNNCIPIHCGYRGRPPATKLPACDCQQKWQEGVFQYIKQTKCYCGHNFDYNNEGTFPLDELPYFLKPTKHSPMQFNYQTVFDLDVKHLQVEKEFKKVWDTDSLLHVGIGPLTVKEEKKKIKKKSSETCLGQDPKPEDYLKCAFRLMRQVNVAARLPDLHLVPELKEWMRRRLHGPLSQEEKAELLRKSTTYWRYFSTLAIKGFGHIAPSKEAQYTEGHTNWLNKKKLNQNFKRYTHRYRLAVYRSHAYVTNLLWRSMYQAEQPDKKFREIFFSYLFAKLEDLHLIKPYNYTETQERQSAMSKRRYICLPKGADAINL